MFDNKWTVDSDITQSYHPGHKNACWERQEAYVNPGSENKNIDAWKLLCLPSVVNNFLYFTLSCIWSSAGYKNACWERQEAYENSGSENKNTDAGKLLCLPGLLLLGGNHSGAMGLAQKLKDIPGILTDTASDSHYWSEMYETTESPCWIRAPPALTDTASDSHYWSEMYETTEDYVRGCMTASQMVKKDKSLVIMDHSLSTFAFYTSAGGKMVKRDGSLVIMDHSLSTFAFYTSAGGKLLSKVKRDESLVIIGHSLSTFAFCTSAGGKAHQDFADSISSCVDECNAKELEKEECLDKICYPKALESDQKDQTCYPEALESDQKTCYPKALESDQKDQTCYPEALDYDQKAARSFGYDWMKDQNVPMLMRGVYGSFVPKLVIMLRNPVDRLHSAYFDHPKYHAKYGNSSEGFGSYVEEQVSEFQTCQRQHGEVKCTLIFEALGLEQEKVNFHVDQILQGMYSIYVERWLRFFPRSSILFIKADEYFDSEEAQIEVLRQVCLHVGVDVPSTQDLAKINAKHTPRSHAKGRDMDPIARRRLTEFYAPYNTRLGEILNDAYYMRWNKLSTALGIWAKKKGSHQGFILRPGAVKFGVSAEEAKANEIAREEL
eukprot:gene6512-3152_t